MSKAQNRGNLEAKHQLKYNLIVLRWLNMGHDCRYMAIKHENLFRSLGYFSGSRSLFGVVGKTAKAQPKHPHKGWFSFANIEVGLETTLKVEIERDQGANWPAHVETTKIIFRTFGGARKRHPFHKIPNTRRWWPSSRNIFQIYTQVTPETIIRRHFAYVQDLRVPRRMQCGR